MGLFKKRVPTPVVSYDSNTQKPVIKCSICNGEQVAGFKNKSTGEFTEVMLIRNQDDLNCFMKMYELSDISKEY